MAAGCEDGLQRGLHSASLAGLSSSVSDHLRAQDRLSRNPDEGPGKGSLVCQVRFPTSVSTSSAERLCSGPLPLRPQFHSFIFICNFSVVLVQEVGSHLEPNPMQDDLRMPSELLPGWVPLPALWRFLPPPAARQHGGGGDAGVRDGRLQQRGQAPVSHLHQAGHPGLVLLLAGML